MDFRDVVRVGSELPDVEVSTSYGTPALKVRGRSFCRLWGPDESERKGPEPGDVLVVFCDLDEKPMLIESAGGALFDQEHYVGHPALLVRLADVDDALLKDVLTESWRQKAPKRLLGEFDATGG